MPPPSLSSTPIKAIIAAGSGTGKTGALWSLAKAGFNLKIYDADVGTSILASILENEPEALARIDVNSFTNKTKADSDGWMTPVGTPKAWSGFLGALNQWPGGAKGEGPNTWGPDTVVVIDSLTLFGRHALLHAIHIEGKNRWKPELQHYGVAMAQIEAVFANLYGTDTACHVLWLSHVKDEFDDDGNFTGSFVSSLGRALKDTLPRYVNDILSIRVAGSGNMAKRYLSTKPTENRLITKTRSIKVKDEYLLAAGREPKPGLAEFFADNGWPGPGA